MRGEITAFDTRQDCCAIPVWRHHCALQVMWTRRRTFAATVRHARSRRAAAIHRISVAETSWHLRGGRAATARRTARLTTARPTSAVEVSRTICYIHFALAEKILSQNTWYDLQACWILILIVDFRKIYDQQAAEKSWNNAVSNAITSTLYSYHALVLCLCGRVS